MTPALGVVVHVWPMPGPRVRSHDPAILNRYLPPEGADLPWSPWLEEMHGQGHVSLTDPRVVSKPAPSPAAKPE